MTDVRAVDGARRAYPWPALLTAFSGVFMAIMDVFIVFVAAPAIQADLRASDAAVQLVLAGYQVAYAITLVTGGRLGDRYGRRRVFAVGLAVFTVASAACGLAPGAASLIGARLVQGVGAALLFPQAFSLVQALVPAESRGRAFGVLGVVIGSSTIVGQLLGGVLVQADLAGLSWRPVFLINVPIGVLALYCARRFVPESRAEHARRLDLAGALVLASVLALLVVPLVQGRELGWPPWSVLCLLVVPVGGAGFVALQRRTARAGGEPLVDLALFAERSVAVGLCLVLVWYMAMNSFFLVLSLTLQDGLGLSALAAGLSYAPLAVCFLVSSLLAPRLAARLGRGPRRLLALGAGVTVAGFGALAAVSGLGLSVGRMVPVLMLLGLGMGLFQSPLLGAVLARVGPRHHGTASGLLATAQQVGGAVGVALIGLLYFAALPGHAPVTGSVTGSVAGSAAGSAAGSVTGSVAGHAHAFSVALLFNAAVVTACLVLLTALYRRSQPVSG
ncbi:DHA2 family efflux MFS transporter permease subunit [Pseudonocardia acaciae]|uniref:DHA2 family efflux MFS transporter permease subunit n=1 Tax=Pseudonocardia acaciae TaxID=551276 RepID=UPI00048C3A8B|nr:DHA2 family efflux MFS transporter permease subunit [Pseudonocardia acaciae]